MCKNVKEKEILKGFYAKFEDKSKNGKILYLFTKFVEKYKNIRNLGLFSGFVENVKSEKLVVYLHKF